MKPGALPGRSHKSSFKEAPKLQIIQHRNQETQIGAKKDEHNSEKDASKSESSDEDSMALSAESVNVTFFGM